MTTQPLADSWGFSEVIPLKALLADAEKAQGTTVVMLASDISRCLQAFAVIYRGRNLNNEYDEAVATMLDRFDGGVYPVKISGTIGRFEGLERPYIYIHPSRGGFSLDRLGTFWNGNAESRRGDITIAIPFGNLSGTVNRLLSIQGNWYPAEQLIGHRFSLRRSEMERLAQLPPIRIAHYPVLAWSGGMETEHLAYRRIATQLGRRHNVLPSFAIKVCEHFIRKNESPLYFYGKRVYFSISS